MKLFALFIYFKKKKKFMRLFSPAVTGLIIILFGINQSTSILDNILSHQEIHKYAFITAVFAILAIVVCNIWGKGIIKILPILIEIVVSYIFALVWGMAGLAPKINFSN